MRYVLGLDIGITSVGWSVINLDRYKIENLGARTFPRAENPKDGKSLALPRRLARGQRRTIDRRAQRMQQIKSLIIRTGIRTADEIESMYSASKNQKDVWELRKEGLDGYLEKESWSRVLIHLAKRRGFKSNKRIKNSGEKEAEEKGLKGAISENGKLMQSKGYRSVGEMIVMDEKFNASKRNKGGEYKSTISRDMLVAEVHQLFESQRAFGNPYATEEFETEYLKIFEAQRPFANKEQLLKLVGKCTFERKNGEKRAAKASYTFAYFTMLQKINGQRVKEKGLLRFLTQNEREKLIAYLHEHDELTYYQARKLLDLDDTIRFVGVNYKKDGNLTADYSVEKKTKLAQMKFVSDIKRELTSSGSGIDFAQLSKENLDKLGHELTFCKNHDELCLELGKLGFESALIEAVSDLSYNGVGNLSLKAMRRIIPYLEQGLLYHEACEEAGYDFRALSQGNKQKYLPVPEQEDITNPVVKRAVAQARKVINAVIRQYGSPYRIHIELARELAKNFDDRKKISKEQDENRSNNEKLVKDIREIFNFDPKGQDIIKYRLFKEQDGRCLYSMKSIDRNLLFGDPNYTEIDHILPYSRSFDDTFANKALVLTAENRQKGNRTPYEYLNKSIQEWEEYEILINETFKKISKSKKSRLLRKSFSLEDSKGFKDRSLQDTQYATRFLSQFVKENLLFSLDDGKRITVMTINGRMTSYLRKRWGLSKIREDGDKHHALDATVIAAASFEMIKEVARISKMDELKYVENLNKFIDPETGEILNRTLYDGYERHVHKFKMPEPWEGFRLELESRLSNRPSEYLRHYNFQTYTGQEIEDVKAIMVSRAPNRNVTGPAHEATIRSPRLFNEGYTVSKVPLDKISFDENGDFEMYNKASDTLLYDAIKARYLEFGKKRENAFKTELFKPKSDGTPGHVVKKVKVMDKSTSGVFVHEGDGIADNGGMIRVDVFSKDLKYFLVPIYTADVAKQELPNRAVTLKKRQSDWVVMDSSYEFKFSLFKDDLVRVASKTGIKAKSSDGQKTFAEVFGYFSGLNISSMGININAHDSNWKAESIGSKTLSIFEKYHIDVLGNVSVVKKEKRLGFSNANDLQPIKTEY